MARPGRPGHSKSAQPLRQSSRFHHSINPDRVFGTHSSLKQNLLAELKPPSDLVLTLTFDVLDMGSRHLVQGHPDLSGRLSYDDFGALTSPRPDAPKHRARSRTLP